MQASCHTHLPEFESRIRWKNPKVWHYRSGQPRYSKQKKKKKSICNCTCVAWRRDFILWGNKIQISVWPPYFHPAHKILLLWSHLKIKKTNILMQRHKTDKGCHLVSKGAGPSLCGKGEQTLLVLKAILPCSEVKHSCSARRLNKTSNLWSG